MAQMFLARIGNFLDDTCYSKVIIAPEFYRAIDLENFGIDNLDPDWEFVIDIVKAKPDWVAFDEDDFNEIKEVIKEFNF